MAKKVLEMENLISDYDRGLSVAILSDKYNVHPSTIRRYLRDAGRKLFRPEKSGTKTPQDVRIRLEIILENYNIECKNELIKELNSNFYMEVKKDEDTIFEQIEIGDL